MKMAPLFLALALCAAGGASSPSEPPRAGSPCPQEGGPPAIYGEPPSPAAEGPRVSRPRPDMEFILATARCIHPAYRTWDFAIAEAGLYAFDIVPPDDATRPAVRIWIDDIQIGFARDAEDYAAKADANGRFRRLRWLEAGTHTLDLYLHFGSLEFQDEMEKAMGEKGVRITLMRLGGSQFTATVNGRDASSPRADAMNCVPPVAGFWQEGTDPDCLARVMGEPLVVAGCCAGGASSPSEPPREFTMEVRPARDKSVVSAALPADVPHWSQTLTISNTPARFSYPCSEEGAFQYLIRDAATGEVVEGPWDFVVTDLRHEAVDGIRLQSDAIEVDRVDCTESAGGPHLFREGGESEIVETPDGAYRQTGPKGCRDTFYKAVGKDGEWEKAERGKQGRGMWRRDFDWFGYTLHVEHPGKTHLLVCRIPNDVRRLTHVFAFDRRTGRSNAWGLDTGDAPAAGAWSEMRIPVWPNTNVIDVMVVNTDGVRNSHAPHPNRRGAVASFELLEYPDGLPPLPAPDCGWNGRMFGWDGEQIDLGPNERAMPRLSDAAAASCWQPDTARKDRGPAYGWDDFASAWERTFELEAWRGGNILLYPVFSYGMVSFQGPAQKIIPPANDRYAVDRVGAGNADPFDRDVFALMLQRAQKHGVQLVADFMVQRTYADVAAAWARRFGMDGATNGFYLSKTSDGTPFRSPSIYAGLPNPAHPVARAAQIEFCREFGRRYGRYTSFAGIHHRFWTGWAGSFEPWFLDADTGFDDFTVGEFSKATGIALSSVGTNETAFSERKAQLLSTYAREWESWRCEVCRSLHEEMLAALQEGAPAARFFMASSRNAFEPGTGLCKDDFIAKPGFGFDPGLLLMDGPGVEINRVDPAKFGNFFLHLNQEGSPLGKRVVPSYFVCNRSFRASPYHLEAAALALAENRLDTLLAGGQWTLPPADDALRDFVRAYRAIPDLTDWRPAEAGHSENYAPVAVWWAQEGDDILFWAVNRTDAERKVVLRFGKEPEALEDCVSGAVLQMPASAGITLAPFMPGVYRAKGAGALLSYGVPVEPEEAVQIERDFAFIASLGAAASGGAAHGEPPSPAAVSRAGSPYPQEGGPRDAPVEVCPHSGRTYFAPAGALSKLDERWTWRDLFAPMQAAHEAGDLHTLRALVQDFRTNHRWWFEAFGWPEDFCVTRKVARKTLAGYLDFQRRIRKEEIWLENTNAVSTAAFPQAKGEFVCVPQGVAIDIFHQGPPGGLLQLEITALFGGGYGDIRVEDSSGAILGAIAADEGTASPRLETRILSVPIPNPGRQIHIRLVGTGGKGLAIHSLGFARLPSRPVSQWQVIGPFDAGRRQRKSSGDAVESASFPPEDGFDPTAEYEGLGGKTIGWREISLGPGERVLDLKPLAPCDTSSEFGVAYLHATIASPSARRTVLRWANDWFGTIWLNGEAIVPRMNGPSKEYGSVEVHLRPGKNEILVKSAAGSSGAWFFGMAVDDDGTLQY